MIDKYAERLRARPWCLERAANSLQAWAHGTQVLQPPLDVSACAVRMEPDRLHRRTVGPHAVNGAMPLEPRVLAVYLQHLHRDDPCAGASDQARFVYPLAAEIVAEHGCSYTNAISMAERCWVRLSAQRQRDIGILSAELEADDVPMELVVQR